MKNSCIIFPFKRFFCTMGGGLPGDMGVCGRIPILSKKSCSVKGVYFPFYLFGVFEIAREQLLCTIKLQEM